MTAVEHDKIELDYCPVCHGIWFDKGELELLLDSLAGGTAREMINSVAQRPGQETGEKNRKCPICHRRMRKAGMGLGGEIIIDVCNAGHGLWFDGGESGAFIKQLELEQPGTATPLDKALFFIRDAFQVNPGPPGKS